MSTNPNRLDCSTGCCKDKLMFLFEQHYADQDELINAIQTDHIELMNYVEYEVVPFLEMLAQNGDQEARDIMISLFDYL